jgi:hypothetical protein
MTSSSWCPAPRRRQALKADTATTLVGQGLRLSEAKTHINHVDNGFDFRGFRIPVAATGRAARSAPAQSAHPPRSHRFQPARRTTARPPSHRSVSTVILPAGATAPACQVTASHAIFVTVPWTQTADLTSWYLRAVPVNLMKCVFPAAAMGRRRRWPRWPGAVVAVAGEAALADDGGGYGHPCGGAARESICSCGRCRRGFRADKGETRQAASSPALSKNGLMWVARR